MPTPESQSEQDSLHQTLTRSYRISAGISTLGLGTSAFEFGLSSLMEGSSKIAMIFAGGVSLAAAAGNAFGAFRTNTQLSTLEQQNPDIINET